jgi:hypothetical protein
MAGVVLPNGKNYFATSTGAPAVGYKVYTYVPGTSTPKDTYTTSAASVANANPVILDSRGEAAIYWVGDYDVVLKDSTDATIWGPERLNQPEASGIRADLINSSDSAKGDALVAYKRTDSGATARTLHDVLKDEAYSVKDFGALGNDSADDYTAIAACITAAVAAGKAVVFPPGTYRHSTTIALGYAKLRVYGIGYVALKYTGSGTACVSIDAGAGSLLYDHVFDNFTIIGNSTASLHGLYVRNVLHRTTRNIHVRDVKGSAFRIEGDVLSHYIDCFVTGAGGAFTYTPDIAFYLSGSAYITACAACTFQNCVAETAASYGWYLNKVDNGVFLGGTSEGLSTGTGLYMSVDTNANQFENFFCELNVVGGDLICYGKRNRFTNCTMASRAVSAPYESTVAITVKNGAEQNVFEGGQSYYAVIESGAIANKFDRFDCWRIDDSGTRSEIFQTRQIYNTSTITPMPPLKTFTPTWGGSTTDGTVTYTTQIGKYQLLNGVCEFTITLIISAISAAPTGNLLVKGLPFTPISGNTQPISVSYYAGLTLPASRVQLAAEVSDGATSIRLQGLAGGFAGSVLQGSDLGATGAVILSGRYFVA